MFSYEEIQKFSTTDFQIYKYIIENGEKIPSMTIRELAKEVYYSTTTILRFCEKIGCSSYNEFKKRIKNELHDVKEIAPKSDVEEIQHYFTKANSHSFEQKINEGLAYIIQAKTVVFLGQGSSGTLARYGARYFSNLGKFSIGLEDTFYPITKDLQENTVLIVLSVSGETKEIIAFIERFKSPRTKVLSITNESNSTIAKISDWNIAYNVEYMRTIEGYNGTTQVPVIFLIEALARRIT